MPADTDRKHVQQQQPKSVLLRSDQDSGMALVKSKDGRTKWLTVSADPSSTSFTWDERVRSWASKLGVCAQPPLPPSKQATPLPTPPPDDLEEQQDRWPAVDATEEGSAAAAATTAAVVAVASGAGSGAISSRTRGATTTSGAIGTRGAQSGAIDTSGVISAPETTTATAATTTPPPSLDSPPACSPVAAKKQPGNAKRVGSFARGFLLGLGGGGSGGGIGTVAAATPTRSVGGCAEPVTTSTTMRMEAEGDAHAPASTLPDISGLKATQSDCSGGGGGGGGPEPCRAGGEGVSSVSGRDRWVKGAPDSPTNSSDDGGDGDSYSGFANGNKRGMDGGYDGGGGGSGGGGCEVDARVIGARGNVVAGRGGGSARLSNDLSRSSSSAASAAAAAAAAAAAGGDARGGDSGGTDGDDGMAWLDTGPGSGSGGSVKASSKKKKKSKAKGKGGGKTKKACPGKSTPSSNDLLTAEREGGGGGGGGAAAAAAAAAGAVAAGAGPGARADPSSLSKAAAKRARSNKQRKALNVTFGCVRLLEFTRDVGGCGVPGDGTWGLALGLPFRETSVEVDGYEASKTEILEERTAELSKRQRHLSTGETRQFDHRPVGERNPLFSRLDEKERSKKLLDYACFHKGDLKEVDRDNSQNSQNSNDSSRSDCQPHGGADASGFCAFSHKVSHAEFVDKSHAASPELTALRHSRRVSQGCSCACVRADKLNLAKLRGELNKRGLKASGSKKELAKVLQEAMRREDEEDGGRGHKVCRSEDCQCVKDGVECHADLCNCCKGPSIGHKDVHHGGNCGNPEGVYAYSSNVVRSHRHPYVTKKIVPGRERGHSRSDSMGS